MSEEDSLVLRIIPDIHCLPGYAMMLVSIQDAKRFNDEGWSLEKPASKEYPNKVKFSFRKLEND